MRQRAPHIRPPLGGRSAACRGATQDATEADERMASSSCPSTACLQRGTNCNCLRHSPSVPCFAHRRPETLCLLGNVHFRISLTLNLLVLVSTPILCGTAFGKAEPAGGEDVELPLPRPFDATACGLQHLAQQQQLLQGLENLHPHATHRLLKDKSVQALYKAKQSKLVVEEALRLIEFGRQAKVSVRLLLKNEGTTAASAFYFVLPYSEATQLGWLTAKTLDGRVLSVEATPRLLPRISALKPIDWMKLDLLVDGIERRLALASEGRGSFASACWPHVFKVQLSAPLDALKETRIHITYLLGRPYRPLPRRIDLDFVQSVVFATSANWPAPYRTLRSALALRLPPQTTFGEEGERRMREKSFRKMKSEVWRWESKTPIEPLATVEPFAVVFPLPLHLGYLVTMERLIVAPFQRAVVYQDVYKVHNDAAIQKGAFNPITMAQLQGLPAGISRLTMKDKNLPRGTRFSTHVLFDLHASLPPDVFDLDVGDMAGNLTSTFAFREGPEETPTATHLEVWPRYPVLGGWNIDLNVKYKVPINSIVEHAPGTNRWSLHISLEPPFPDLYLEDVSLTVLLPIGATNIRYTSPIDFEIVEETSLRWWLDIITSRPALRLRWHAVSSFSQGDMTKRVLVVTYDYPYPVDLEFFKELFFLALLVLLIFAVILIYGMKLRYFTFEGKANGLQDTTEQGGTKLGDIAEEGDGGTSHDCRDGAGNQTLEDKFHGCTEQTKRGHGGASLHAQQPAGHSAARRTTASGKGQAGPPQIR